MADTKITALTALTAADPANDVIPIVDVSDTTMAASGTTKKISVNNILGASGTATLASATITGAATVGTTLGVTGNATLSGDLTVRTSKLFVNATGVGIGNAGPLSALTVSSQTDARLSVRTTESVFGSIAGGTALDSLNDAATTLVPFGCRGSSVSFCASGQNIGLQLDASSNVNVPLGNVVMGTSGKGIDFSATTSGSGTMTSELLNDYEEGTWTPVVADATTGGNVGTCTISHARYTKIGRQVSVECSISTINTTGMTGGNPFYIRGLPFASVTGGNGNFYSFRVGRNASTVSSSVFCQDSTSYVYFPLYTTNSATTGIFLLVSDIVSGTSEIALSVTYYV